MTSKIHSLEINDETLTQRGVNAILDFYHTMAIAEKNTLGARMFVTGAKSPFLNVLFDIRQDRTKSDELIKLADSFFASQDVLSWGWFIIPASHDNDLLQSGFELIEEAPAMYFDLANPLPLIDSDSITIKEAKNIDTLQDWDQIINDGFQAEEGDNSFFKLNADLLNEGEKKLKHFIGYYKNEAATAGTLFLSDEKTIMIHNVATKTNFKKKGLGTALTLYMMEIAKKAEFQHCYLDSSEEAFNLYKRLGFKVYATTLIYKKS